MQIVNIHEAKTHLSKIVEKVSHGDSFIIAKAGKPLVKIVPLNTPDHYQQKKIGFLAGQIIVPDDFDRMGSDEIEILFGKSE